MIDIQKERSREAFEEFEFQKRPFASKKVLFQKYDPARIGDRDGNEGKYYCAEMQEKWEIWQHVAQAIPKGFVLVPKDQIKGYYSHDGDNYQVHETLNQAKSNALSAIEHYSDQLADGNFHPENDGNFQDIGFGIVLGKSDYSLVHIVTQQDIDDGESKYPVGTEILELHLDETMIEAAEGN